jgi:hypothetical protein
MLAYMLIHAGIIFLSVYDAYSDRLGTEIIYLLHVHLHQDDICLEYMERLGMEMLVKSLGQMLFFALLHSYTWDLHVLFLLHFCV